MEAGTSPGLQLIRFNLFKYVQIRRVQIQVFVLFLSLQMYPDLAGQALQSTICRSPGRFTPKMFHWLSETNWLMLSLSALATVPILCRFTFKIGSRREVQIEGAQDHPHATDAKV